MPDQYYGTDLNSGAPQSSAQSFGGSDNSLLQPRVASITSNGGSNNSLMQSLIAQLQSSSDAANKDSLAQYQNLLKSVAGSTSAITGPGGYFAQAQKLQAGNGAAEMQQLKNQQKSDLGQAAQSSVDRGLGNTTIQQGMLNGVNQSSQLAQNSLTEGINNQQAGLLTQEAGAAQNLASLNANAITAKQNQSPDLSMYLNLLQSLGRTGGGGTPQQSGVTASTFGLQA